MTDNPLIKHSGSILGDLASCFGIPTGTAINLFHDFVNRRGAVARDILLEEIRAGNLDELHAANDDETISIMYRYGLAVRDGAARRNIRLLAQAIVGLARRDNLYSDVFNKYVEVLSRLSRDQIFLLGRYYGIWQVERKETADGQQAAANSWNTLIRAFVTDKFETKKK